MSWTDQLLEPDTKNLEKTIEKINHYEGHEIIDYANHILPNWIVSVSEKYAEEYSILEQNWKNLCAQWKTTPKRIIIVDFLPEKGDFRGYHLLEAFCNHLTVNGYVIRNKTELVACKTCGCALLTQRVYSYLLQNKSTLIPSEWNENCLKCQNK